MMFISSSASRGMRRNNFIGKAVGVLGRSSTIAGRYAHLHGLQTLPAWPGDTARGLPQKRARVRAPKPAALFPLLIPATFPRPKPAWWNNTWPGAVEQRKKKPCLFYTFVPRLQTPIPRILRYLGLLTRKRFPNYLIHVVSPGLEPLL